MENIKELFTNEIKLPPNNMREHIDRDTIFELADDIKKNGLISPITVREMSCGEHEEFGIFYSNDKVPLKCLKCFYELVAGQRRYLAHQVGGLINIKCIIKKLTDEEAFAIMTSENLARVDVNPVDEAKHVGRLVERENGDLKKVAHIVNRGEQWVKDRLAVSQMPEYMQTFLAEKQIKLGVALILMKIEHDNLRRMWTEQAVRDGVNVAMAEYWYSDYKRQLLPGGELAGGNIENTTIAPPTVIKFTCDFDGKQYDTRLCKTLIIAEENLPAFYALRDAFLNSPE